VWGRGWSQLDERRTFNLALGEPSGRERGLSSIPVPGELMEPTLCPDVLPGLHLPYHPYHTPLPFFLCVTSFLSFYHISLAS